MYASNILDLARSSMGQAPSLRLHDICCARRHSQPARVLEPVLPDHPAPAAEDLSESEILSAPILGQPCDCGCCQTLAVQQLASIPVRH